MQFRKPEFSKCKFKAFVCFNFWKQPTIDYMKPSVFSGAIAALSFFLFVSCSDKQASGAASGTTNADSLQAVVDNLIKGKAVRESNLNVFDTLDFVVYSKQQWDRLHESHSKDIVVHYPDGTSTTGLDAHIHMLEPMFTFAPDTHIDVHPIRFGTEDGKWTSVTGITQGTFSKPMNMGNGKLMQPTGKSFNLNMCTIGRWENGVMVEEWLFWDNYTMMKQIGLAQ